MAKTATLVDNFATYNTTVWNVAGAAAIQNGRAELPRDWNFNTNVTTDASTWDLTASSFVCKVTHPVTGHDTSGPVWSTIALRLNSADTNRVTFFIETTGAGVSTIKAQSQEVGVNGGAITDRWTATYSTTDHLWLRFREVSSTLYWDTSPNNSTWTNRASLARTMNPTTMQVFFSSAFNGGVGGTQGTTWVDDVNAAAALTGLPEYVVATGLTIVGPIARYVVP